MNHKLTAIFLVITLTAIVATSSSRCLAEQVLVKDGKANCAIVIGNKSTVPERNICKVIQTRIRKRTGCHVPIVEEKDAQQAIAAARVVVVVGTPFGNDMLLRLCKQAGRLVPDFETTGPGGFVIHTLEQDGKVWIVLAGSDTRGTVCAVGKFFRKIDFSDRGATIGRLAIVDKIDPAETMNLQQQKPAQWGNAFQDAPAEQIRGYIEDIALWGSPSMLSLCNWGINNPFREDSDARSREKLTRILKLLTYAGSLGVDVGYFDYPNCVYDDQRHLRKLGGKFHPVYTHDTCPSIPEVRKVLLENRENLYRTAGELGVKFSYIVHNPHDFGGCACDKCEPWILTWIELSEEVHSIAVKYHPNVKMYLTTWMCSREEIQTLFDFVRMEKPEWLAGIVGRRGVMDGSGGKLPPQYALVSWQTIFGCGAWECYGRMGADPMPLFLQRKMRDMNKLGFRTVHTYSEGIYDDINTAIVAQMCRRPFRKDVRELLVEYCHSNFGTTDADSATLADLILTKFEHTKQRNNSTASLRVADPESVLAAMEQIESRMPSWGRDDWHWGILKMRVRLEELNKRALTHNNWPKELSAILAGAVAKDNDVALVDALGKAGTYLADLNTSFGRLEKECDRLTRHLYVNLYGTPNRDIAHGPFRLQLTKRDLVSVLIKQCGSIAKEQDATTRKKDVTALLKTLDGTGHL